jgi:hypothetical protein
MDSKGINFHELLLLLSPFKCNAQSDAQRQTGLGCIYQGMQSDIEDWVFWQKPSFPSISLSTRIFDGMRYQVIVRPFMMLIAACTVACGAGDGEDSSTPNPAQEACEQGEVLLEIASPLPVELGGSCAKGDPTLLEALVIYDDQNCTVDVSDEGAAGVCACVSTNQTLYATLSYRIASTKHKLSEQGTYIYFSKNSVENHRLSFAGEDVLPQQDNLDSYCAGLQPS